MDITSGLGVEDIEPLVCPLDEYVKGKKVSLTNITTPKTSIIKKKL